MNKHFIKQEMEIFTDGHNVNILEHNIIKNTYLNKILEQGDR